MFNKIKNLRKKVSLDNMKIGKKKKLTIFILCIILVGLTIGYSTFYSNLFISPFAIVKPNFSTFSVVFSNSPDTTDTSPIVPVASGAEATSANISNKGNPTISRMNVVFSEPGQSVTYTFYVRNVGEYTAFLNNVIFENSSAGDNFKVCSSIEGTNQTEVDQACNYIKFSLKIGESLTFTGSEKITNHEFEVGQSEKIVINISYEANDIVVNGDFSVDFGLIALAYSSIGDYNAESGDNGGEVADNTLYNTILLNDARTSSLRKAKSYIASKPEVSFANQSTTDEGLNITQDEDGIVYYYRGRVNNNHVLFAGFCWEIIRTTGTGGVKIHYDGVPSNGVCTKSGQNSIISNVQFSSSINSPAYIGYMYGNVYTSYSKSMDTLSGNIIYGNDITFNKETGEYTLVDTIEKDVANYATDYSTIASKYHYTCFNNQITCNSVNYIYRNNNSTSYYFILIEGKKHVDILDEMLTSSTNTYDSAVKKAIDSWYKKNMLEYTSQLEDTVFCNDRSIYSYGGWDKDESNSKNLTLGAYGRLVANKKPSLICPKLNDKFTVNLEIGNGDLTYPVGMITADEIALAGGVVGSRNISYYIYNGNVHYRSMSPYQIHEASVFTIGSWGEFNLYSVLGTNGWVGVRPVVSLKPGTIISGGDGSSSSPYII